MSKRAKKWFAKGDRVREINGAQGVVPYGTLGTVAVVRTRNGSSVHCDVAQLQVFVVWDTGLRRGEYKRFLEKVRNDQPQKTQA